MWPESGGMGRIQGEGLNLSLVCRHIKECIQSVVTVIVKINFSIKLNAFSSFLSGLTAPLALG